MTIVYLYPKSGYRTELRSDTLWGLLCWGIQHLYGPAELERVIESYGSGNPEFIISSAFPFKQIGRDRMRFYPKPDALALLSDAAAGNPEEIISLRKELNAVRWLEESVFLEFLAGRFAAADLLEMLRQNEPGHRPPQKRVLSFTHNTIDRIKGATLTLKGRGQLFHADEIYWEDPENDSDDGGNTGLFFLLEGDTTKLLPVFRFLTHFGWGGDRSSGKGSFRFEVDDRFTLEQPAAGNAFVNLSLYYPRASELQVFDRAADRSLPYSLVRRAGKVGFVLKHIPKDPALFFREGSLFPALEGLPGSGGWGELLSWTPREEGLHTIYRYGIGFMVKTLV